MFTKNIEKFVKKKQLKIFKKKYSQKWFILEKKKLLSKKVRIFTYNNFFY